MSNGALRLLAGAGAKDDPVYVDDVFSTFLYAGTGSSLNIVTGIDLSGEGGLVWTKSRTSAVSNQLTDTVSGYRLESDDTYAGEASQGNVTFNSNGHTQASGSNFFNDSGNDFVNWTFRKQPGFFDIVTYTGTGGDHAGVDHGLKNAPGMIVIKRTDSSQDWYVFHRSVGSSQMLKLNSTGAAVSNDGLQAVSGTMFHSDKFYPASTANTSSATYVAYIFAHDAQDFGTDEDESIIKCGTYTGNSGSQTIDVGFEAQWVLIKNTSSSSTDWFVVDVMRGLVDTSAFDAALIRANSSDAEQTSGAGGARITTRSTGFGFISESNLSCNRSGETYVYVAIRRPHKPASEFAATALFAVDNNTTSASASVPNFVSGFPVDMGLANTVDESGYTSLSSRLTGKQLYTSARVVEEGTPEYDYSTGFKEGGSSTNADEVGWMWRRAPGFFDVVCYKGTGSAVWHNHNLGVVPEMIICKGRDIAEYWNVFTTGGGTSSRLHLDEGNEYITNNANQYFPTLPTATEFRIGQNNEIGGSGYNYIAYLFASADGISKLGTYAGTGSAQNIDCGFSAGARFVLIKRVDQAGYWMVWDSVRGIVAGNDPYLVLNTTAAHTTNTDYIDPLASGFTITSSAPTDNSDYSMNKSGGTYFFYAIA